MILDAGCGASPVGDVNCDLLVEFDDLKLWTGGCPVPKNFVRADIRALPFRSRCFDLVHCSHVLEHLEDPLEALRELKRVSRKKVAVILPFALFRIFDLLYHGTKYPDWLRWEKHHHKHFYLMDPLKTGSFKLMFLSLSAALKKQKQFTGLIRIPVPFQTLTVLEVDS